MLAPTPHPHCMLQAHNVHPVLHFDAVSIIDNKACTRRCIQSSQCVSVACLFRLSSLHEGTHTRRGLEAAKPRIEHQ